MKQLQTALLNYKDDHATTGKELDSVLKYLDELKPQCETKVMSRREHANPQPAAPTGRLGCFCGVSK